MELSKDKLEIYHSVLENVSKAIGMGTTKDGSNQITAVINDKNVTIRAFFQDGKMLNVNAFIGGTDRVLGNLINLR